jgi:hypothetical protein
LNARRWAARVGVGRSRINNTSLAVVCHAMLFKLMQFCSYNEYVNVLSLGNNRFNCEQAHAIVKVLAKNVLSSYIAVETLNMSKCEW